MRSMSNEIQEPTSEDIRKMRLPIDKKPYARKLYFNNTAITDIAETYNIKLPTVKSWVYGYGSKNQGGWKAEKETAQNELLKDLSANKRGIIQNMVTNSLFLLHNFVETSKQEVLRSGNPISLKTAEKLTGILTNLHTIVEKEKSELDVDPDFVKPTSVEELKDRVVKADVFAESTGEDDEIIIDADVISSTNSSPTSDD